MTLTNEEKAQILRSAGIIDSIETLEHLKRHLEICKRCNTSIDSGAETGFRDLPAGSDFAYVIDIEYLDEDDNYYVFDCSVELFHFAKHFGIDALQDLIEAVRLGANDLLAAMKAIEIGVSAAAATEVSNFKTRIKKHQI